MYVNIDISLLRLRFENIYRQLTVFLCIRYCIVNIAAVYDVRVYVRVSTVARPRIEGAGTCDWTDAGEGI